MIGDEALVTYNDMQISKKDGKLEIGNKKHNDIYSIIEAREKMQLANNSGDLTDAQRDTKMANLGALLVDKIDKLPSATIPMALRGESLLDEPEGVIENLSYKLFRPSTQELLGSLVKDELSGSDFQKVSVFERVYGRMKEEQIPINSISKEDVERVKTLYKEEKKSVINEAYPKTLDSESKFVLDPSGNLINYNPDGKDNVGVEIDNFGGYSVEVKNGILYNVSRDNFGNIIDIKEAL
jgi:hypothetical protein